MKNLQLIAAAVAAMMFGASVQAHHSFAATFTTDEIEVTGVVTDFRYRNPHVMIYFDVTDDSGEVTQWASVGAAANLLRNRGWAPDELKPGDRIRISGNATRSGAPLISQGDVAILEPGSDTVLRIPGESASAAPAEPVVVPVLALTLPDGRPNFSGAWTMNPAAERGGDGRGGRGTSMGMGMGMGMGGPPRDPSPAFNEAGSAIQAAFDPANDPQVVCEPPGLVRQAGFTPHPVMIRQEADRVILNYEEYGGERVIVLDGARPEPGELSRFGDYYAYYDGDTLVIETINLLGNLSNPSGNQLSDQTTTVETYRRADDPVLGPALKLTTVITDPGHLAEPWTLEWTKWYTPGYEPIENECVPLAARTEYQ